MGSCFTRCGQRAGSCRTLSYCCALGSVVYVCALVGSFSLVVRAQQSRTVDDGVYTAEQAQREEEERQRAENEAKRQADIAAQKEAEDKARREAMERERAKHGKQAVQTDTTRSRVQENLRRAAESHGRTDDDIKREKEREQGEKAAKRKELHVAEGKQGRRKDKKKRGGGGRRQKNVNVATEHTFERPTAPVIRSPKQRSTPPQLWRHSKPIPASFIGCRLSCVRCLRAMSATCSLPMASGVCARCMCRPLSVPPGPCSRLRALFRKLLLLSLGYL